MGSIFKMPFGFQIILAALKIVLKMKVNFTSFFLLLLCFGVAQSQPLSHLKTATANTDDPETVFLNPPEAAKPGVLWMWMGCNLSEKGITHDLEELKKNGFNRTTVFSLADITTPWAGVIGKSPTPEIIAWTEPWWKMVRHAAEESKRLGMDFGIFNGAGYEASGGVWVTPEMSMQELCWSQTKVEGSRHIAVKISKPTVDARGHSPYPMYVPETGLVEIPEIAARKTFYKDVAVLALPASGIVSKDSVVNLTGKMNADGELNWDAPAGQWIIYRFGHTTSGTMMQPAQWKATGLEVDKMDKQAVEFHIGHIIGEIQKHLEGLVGTGFTHVHFDSYEAGDPTWTPKMQQEFLARRGYDLTPMLPIFAGRTIGSKEGSIKLQQDFQATVKDLYRDVYFTVISQKLKKAGLVFLCEPYGGPWRLDDVMPLVGRVMTEFWTNNGVYFPYELKPTVDALRKSGQNIIEAEAFTGDPSVSMWDETPAWLKPIGDAAFCDGVNRFVLHRFVQQPWADKYKPGATMGRWGTHFDRTQTWWKQSKALVNYWQHCQALLQWGKIVLPAADDFNVSDTATNAAIKYIHRNDGKTDIYFVANTSRKKLSAKCTFNIAGMQPELWDPVTATMRKLSQYQKPDGKTTFQINFDEAQSFFVVFRNKEQPAQNTIKQNFPVQKEIKVIDGAWKVTFDTAWGGPAKPVAFSSLQDWTNSPIAGVKYFSGTAVYRKSFKVAVLPAGYSRNLYLDLGTVKHIASVKLNGKDLGIIWTAPWQVKLPSGLLKGNANELEIEVTNVWANRLIGDEQQPADCLWLPGHISGGNSLKEFPDWFLNNTPRPSKERYCFTTWNYFTKDSPLISSGLLGPVRIMQEK